MYNYIYKITNLLDQKIYVGVHKTETLDDGYMGSGSVIKRAIKKYGMENFRKDILEFFDSYEQALNREAEIVTDEFLLREDVYNIRRGGQGGWDYINKNSLNSYDKTGENNPFYGKTHSKETKANLASITKELKTGIKFSESHKENISKSLSGKAFSDDRKKNISEAKKGKPAYNKGISEKVVTCPHCGKYGGNSNMKRWHFDNCKGKQI